MLPDASGNGCITCNLWHIYFSNPKIDQGELFAKISKILLNIGNIQEIIGVLHKF